MHILVALMSQLTPLSEEEKRTIEESIPIKTFPKDSYLLREGRGGCIDFRQEVLDIEFH